MAVQVSATDVINNSRELVNITGIDATTAASITAGGVQGATKAWVTFNGTGTIAIRQSSGISSITDRFTGAYTVAKSSAMSSTAYATLSSKADNFGGSVVPYNHASSGPISTTQLYVEIGSNLTGNTNYGDAGYVSAAFLE